jgi:hypothetical protein
MHKSEVQIGNSGLSPSPRVMMSEVCKKSPGWWARFITWTEAHMVGTVPAEIAECEFDCRQSPCLDVDWVSCERRVIRASRETIEKQNKD